MPTKILKRLGEDARTVHMLMRELLVYSLGWTDVANDGAVFEAPVATGVDGEVDSSVPTKFTSPSGPFNVGHIGMWLTVYGGSNFANNTVAKIVAVPSSTEVVVTGGLYGVSFITENSLSFRVVDPSLNAAGNNSYTVGGIAGSATPLWEAAVSVPLGVTDQIDYDVTPSPVTAVALPTQSISADATQTWYVLIDTTHVRMFTQNTAGTGVFQIGYFGAGEPRRLADDDRFVMAFGGSPLVSAAGSIAAIAAQDQSNTNNLTYSALTLGDGSQANMFDSLPASTFDLRNDSAKISVGTEDVGFEQEDRGYIRGFRYVSDQLTYRSFVDNGRSLLALGDGLAIEWDGSLSR